MNSEFSFAVRFLLFVSFCVIQNLFKKQLKKMEKEKRGSLEDFLLISSAEGRVLAVSQDTEGAKHSLLFYEVLEEKENCSLLDITLITGRKHQIRVQMAKAGHPLLGDRKYGRKDSSYPHLALCAYSLRFDFTTSEGALKNLKGKTVSIRPDLVHENN